MSYPYQPQQPGPGDYGSYQVNQPGQGLAITALVLGILALLTTWVPLLGLVLLLVSVAAIVVGAIALARVSKGVARGRGMALAGLILGVVSLIVGVGLHILYYQGLVRVGEWAERQSSSWSSTMQSGAGGSSPADGTATATDGATGQDPASQGADVSFGEANARAAFASVPVTITNTSPDTATYTIDVEAVGADGEVLSSTSVMAASLEPGASTTSTAAFVAPDPGNDLTDATYRVESVNRLQLELPDAPALPSPGQS